MGVIKQNINWVLLSINSKFNFLYIVFSVNGQKVTGQKVTIYIFYPGGQKV